jgi:outer membrane receptor for ferrienterochelin and colicins
VQTNLLVEAFYTNLKNVFLFEEVEIDGNSNIIQERRNGDGAIVKGINLEARIVPSSKLQIQMGATFQRSLYHNPEKWSENESLGLHNKMFRTPDAYGYLTASYSPVKPLTLSLSGTYTGSMLVQHFIAKEEYNGQTGGYELVSADEEKQTPDFFDVNFKTAYNFTLGKGVDLQLNMGVKNIFNSYQTDFDKGEERDAAYIYGPSLPRSFFFGVKFSM